MASAKKKSNSRSRSSSSRTAARATSSSRANHGLGQGKLFAVCVANEGYKASLELRKIYEVLDDGFAQEHQLVRVVDESGEDYLYASEYFVPVELPTSLQQKLRKIA